jgi:hypothetical protein
MLSLTDAEAGKSGGITLGSVDNKPLTISKTLTDEEIIETVKDHFIGAIRVGIVLTHTNVIDFARAILRKAQGD